MRLSTFSDYCLRVLIYVGAKGDQVSTIGEITDAYRISRGHLMKVVHRLGQLGYLETVRGRSGGMRLAKHPSNIKLGVVIRATEDDLALVACFHSSTSGLCAIEPACVLKRALHSALEAFLRTLDGYTLADLLVPRNRLSQLLNVTRGDLTSAR